LKNEKEKAKQVKKKKNEKVHHKRRNNSFPPIANAPLSTPLLRNNAVDSVEKVKFIHVNHLLSNLGKL